jgi:hypothetical protein
MNDGPIPIRQGVTPQTDTGRELLDLVAKHIAQFSERHDNEPTSIAFVLSGDVGDGNTRATEAHSWDASQKRTRLETCSVAAMMLVRRALNLD